MAAPDWLAIASRGKFASFTASAVTASSTIFTSDMDLFFNDFAQVAILTHAATEYPLNIIFTDAFKSVNPATGEVETTAPQAEYGTYEFSAPVHGDTLLVGSVTYKVIGIQQSDDRLSTILILSRD